MNIANQLPEPLNTFVVDVPSTEYYDFELPVGSTYPLPGVTYPVDYGHIIGHTAEDTYELDLFVGNSGQGLCGSVVVYRGETTPNERKFYVALSEIEVEEILSELKPVLISQKTYNAVEDMLSEVEKYKDAS